MLAITIVLFVVPHNQQIVTIRQLFTCRIPLFRNQNLNIEQIDYIKKYGLLIQFKKLTVFQCVALIALLINFICCLLYHFYFFCSYDIFIFIGLLFYLTIRIRQNIKIPDSLSSSSNLNLYTTIKIEITDKEIILILPNKTIIDNLTKYIEFIVIKNGMLLITDVQNLKNVNIAYIPTKKLSSSEKKKLVKLFYDNGLKRI